MQDGGLSGNWPAGYRAGDIVFYGGLLSEVVVCKRDLVGSGRVPIMPFRKTLGCEPGICFVPADDLEMLAVASPQEPKDGE